jgi:hypothetical protein
MTDMHPSYEVVDRIKDDIIDVKEVKLPFEYFPFEHMTVAEHDNIYIECLFDRVTTIREDQCMLCEQRALLQQ